jgi:signal transduction histidine kinase/uncharacterized membrane protein YhaH (DUF805 family)
MNRLALVRGATVSLLLLGIGLGMAAIESVSDTGRWSDSINNTVEDYVVGERSLPLRLLERSGRLHNDHPINAETANARQLELGLAVVIILLILTSATLLTVQRLHNRELRTRAAIGHLNAAIAISLIDAGPGTFLPQVREAAERLALHIGARRLHLDIPDLAANVQFSETEADLAEDWASKLFAAAMTDDAWIDDRVIASSAVGRTGGALPYTMRQTGVGQLILLRTAEPFRVMVAFEPEDFATAQLSDNLAGILAAMTAIAHSARREVMQLERQRLEQSLAEKRRMANLGVVASGVAHNFNNIIGAIGGFAEIGRGRARVGSVEFESFDEIQGSVERGRALIDDILSYAKQRSQNWTVLNLSGLLSQTIRMLSASRSKTAVHLAEPGEQYFVYGSATDLQQVFINMCNNAVDASEERTVELSVERVELAGDRQMSHGSLGAGRYAVVTIKDSGPGIPETLRPRLFEPFFTTKSGGTGLGLSTAWEIVQRHGGTIHVENSQTGGSRFRVWLPEIATDANGVTAGNGSRILLLAEPDRLSAEEDMLAELGYEPVGFPLNSEMEKISEMIPTVDAVLIATWQSWHASKIIPHIAPRLNGRPLLVAGLHSNNWQHSIAAIPLAYPVRAHQVSALLSEAILR